MDAFDIEKAGESGSTDSGIFPGEAPSADSPGGAARSNSRNGRDCPFIETADGWCVEYYEKECEVRVKLRDVFMYVSSETLCELNYMYISQGTLCYNIYNISLQVIATYIAVY